MLTPGEFVMSTSAVKKHGVGFMNQLNRGRIQGFNKGGPVQYRQEGGILSSLSAGAKALGLDTSGIEDVFSNFVGDFSSSFDNITSAFSGITSALNGVAKLFSLRVN
jgi:hypothetical protein